MNKTARILIAAIISILIIGALCYGFINSDITGRMYYIGGLVLFFVFSIGAVVGSFLNVVILRSFSGESIVMPPSKCPKCNNKLKWWHNIPIISYLLLGGKCGFCEEKISIQYPIVEFITGIIFVGIFIVYGILPETIFAVLIASILIVLAVTDIKERVVFDKHTYFLIVTGLIYNFLLTAITLYNQAFNTISGFRITTEWVIYNPMTSSILGLILGVIVMECLARIGYLIAGERAFGEGDTYIAAGLGAAFGWQNFIIIIVLSVILQIIAILPVYLKKQFTGKHYGVLFSLPMFIILAISYYVLSLKGIFISRYVLKNIMLALIGLFGILSAFFTVKGLRAKDELTYFPFGPALAISGILVLITNIHFTL